MLAVTLLLVAGATARAEASDPCVAANTAFSQGRYAEAARGFESVLADKGFSAPVLYNLANAQLREGRLGSAILTYERAQVLSPNDPDIAANLKLARTESEGRADLAGLGTRFTRLLTLDTWGWVAAAASLILCTAAVLLRSHFRGTIAIRFAGAAGAIALVTALSILTFRWRELDRAIVIARECPMRISPTSMGEQLFPLHEGEAVTLQQTRGEFALVRSQNGRSGWVTRSDVGRVYAAAWK